MRFVPPLSRSSALTECVVLDGFPVLAVTEDAFGR